MNNRADVYRQVLVDINKRVVGHMDGLAISVDFDANLEHLVAHLLAFSRNQTKPWDKRIRDTVYRHIACFTDGSGFILSKAPLPQRTYAWGETIPKAPVDYVTQFELALDMLLMYQEVDTITPNVCNSHVIIVRSVRPSTEVTTMMDTIVSAIKHQTLAISAVDFTLAHGLFLYDGATEPARHRSVRRLIDMRDQRARRELDSVKEFLNERKHEWHSLGHSVHFEDDGTPLYWLNATYDTELGRQPYGWYTLKQLRDEVPWKDSAKS